MSAICVEYRACNKSERGRTEDYQKNDGALVPRREWPLPVRLREVCLLLLQSQVRRSLATIFLPKQAELDFFSVPIFIRRPRRIPAPGRPRGDWSAWQDFDSFQRGSVRSGSPRHRIGVFRRRLFFLSLSPARFVLGGGRGRHARSEAMRGQRGWRRCELARSERAEWPVHVRCDPRVSAHVPGV